VVVAVREDVLLRLAAVVVLIFFSAFFSGSESALFSLSRVQREKMRQSGSRIERLIVALLERPRRLIATILLGNELVNVTISTLVASVVERTLGARLGSFGLSVISTVIVFPLLLFLGEITPKSVALRIPERWARMASAPIAVLAYAVAPLRWVVRGVADTVLWLLGQKQKGTASETLKEEEFRALVDVGLREGEVPPAERHLIHNVFEFGDRTVKDIMTPMERVVCFPYEWPLDRIVEGVKASTYSRIPIYKKQPENVIGILLAKDLIGFVWNPGPLRALGDLLLQPYYVPSTTKCDVLLRQMQRRRTHMAVVVNEYGRTVGICTMEDLLEELFGEISDEKEVPARRGGDGAAQAPTSLQEGPQAGPREHTTTGLGGQGGEPGGQGGEP